MTDEKEIKVGEATEDETSNGKGIEEEENDKEE